MNREAINAMFGWSLTWIRDDLWDDGRKRVVIYDARR